MDKIENLTDEELAKAFIDPMGIDEFKEWLEIPCTIDDLYACYSYYENLPQTSLNIDKLILIDDLIMERILTQVPHRVSDT